MSVGVQARIPGPASYRPQNLAAATPAAGKSANTADDPRVLYPKVVDALGVDLGDGVPSTRPPGPATAYAAAHLLKRADSGLQTLRFAYPATTATQCVGSPRLVVVDSEAQPADCIARYEIRAMPEAPSRNEMRVTFDLSKMPADSFFRYDVQTVVAESPLDLSQPVPIPNKEDIPPDVRRYLVEEPNIEVSAPEIQQAATKIRAQSSSLQDLVTNTRRFMAELPPKGTFQFDALGFLRSGVGSCTSNGHLFAALMRANGVACRPVTGILRGMGQDMHWQNEYYVPGKGWAHIEPQGGKIHSDPQSPRCAMIETGPVEPQMDTSISDQYFMAFFAQPLDAGGAPMPAEKSLLDAQNGLFVVHPAWDTTVHIFGAN